MSKHLDFIKSSQTSKRIIFKPNGKDLGRLIRDVDGEYYFFPNGQGAWHSYVLMEIAVHLAILNSKETT